jgi:plasmid maintenance system antidote protein VapI
MCTELSVNAMHEAMAGTTNAIISLWHGAFITVPIPLAVSLRKVVDPKGQLWNTVRESTEDFRHTTEEHVMRLKEMRRLRLLHQLKLLDRGSDSKM